MKLSLIDKNQNVRIDPMPRQEVNGDRLMLVEDDREVYLGSRKMSYNEGDFIRLEVDEPNSYIMVKFDDTFEESLIYIKEPLVWDYKIPYSEEEKRAMKDSAFTGRGLAISARLASDEEIKRYQNVLRNRHATVTFAGVYPYAHANVETRNDPTFFARNAIDGIFHNDDHGLYPFQSWGINQQDDAAITIELGREVEVNRVGITIRSDFPHDTWWNQVTLEFSDGSHEIINLKKDHHRQFFDIKERKIEWVKMCEMKKGEPGPFPALTQLELFGYNL